MTRLAMYPVAAPLTAVLTAALLSACSGGDKIVSPDDPGGSNNTALAAADSVFLAASLMSAGFDAVNNLRRMPVSALPAVFSNQPPCTPTTTTGGADSDNNGIPDDKTVQFTAAGCTVVSNGTTNVVTGTVRVEDRGGIIGYRVTYTDFTVQATKGDSVVRSVITGTFEYRWVSATSATALDNSTVSIEARSSTGSVKVSRSANLNASYTPSSGRTIARNGLFPSGSLSLNGTLSITATVTGDQVQPGLGATQTLTMNVSTTTDLAYSSACNNDASVSAGNLSATVSGSNQGALTVRYSGCGVGTGSSGLTPPAKR